MGGPQTPAPRPRGGSASRHRRHGRWFVGLVAALSLVALAAPGSASASGIPLVVNDTRDMLDSNLTDSVTIMRVGDGEAIVDGGFPPDGSPVEQKGMDRLFEVHPSVRNVTFSNMTLREGFSPEDGGGIQ